MYERLSQKLDTFREQQLTACQLVLKAFLKMYSSTPQGFDIVKIVRQLQIDNQAKGKYEESFVVTKHLKVTVSFSEENCHLQLLESTNKFLFQNAQSKYFQNSVFFNRSFMSSEAQSDVIQQHILRVVNNARNEVDIISSWGDHNSSGDSSMPTILRSRVRIPSTSSKLLYGHVFNLNGNCTEKMMKLKKRPGLAHI